MILRCNSVAFAEVAAERSTNAPEFQKDSHHLLDACFIWDTQGTFGLVTPGENATASAMCFFPPDGRSK
ncbi:hypothetical protein ANO14919_025750 [Xylariales sp. No.14919]|nr:hypothetical protein ANO14919_025750 [Xylariales sp. No.14919]